MTKDKMGIVSTSTQKPLIGYIGTNHLLIMLVQTIDWLYWYKPFINHVGTNHSLVILVQTIEWLYWYKPFINCVGTNH